MRRLVVSAGVVLSVLSLVGANVLVEGPPAAASTSPPVGTITLVARGHVNPAGITTGPDGNLWFTQTGTDAIGRVNPAGTFVTFTGAGIKRPTGIANGPDGNLWFTNQGNDSIGRITPAGVVSNFTGIGIAQPTAVIGGPDGNLWFTNQGNDSIGRITPAGFVSTFTGPGVKGPTAIASGPDGNLWFTNVYPNIGRITPAGIVSSFSGVGMVSARSITSGPGGNLWIADSYLGDVFVMTPTGEVIDTISVDDAGVEAIAYGPDGNVWVTDGTDGRVTRVTPQRVVTTFSIAGPLGSTAITPGPDGNIWFTGYTDSVTRITPAGIPTNFRVTGITRPSDLVVGPDGNVWFTNSLADTIGRVTPAGVTASFSGPGISEPRSIAVGPDGNLWFTNPANDSIGRITTAGVVSSITAPGIDRPWGITSGPDGNLWFTNRDGNSIGRVTPGGIVSTYAGGQAVAQPMRIVAGSDGTLWFVNAGNHSIGRITTAGVVTNFAGGAITTPDGLVAGPGGDIWFLNQGSLGRITPAGVSSSVNIPSCISGELALGADGNLWAGHWCGPFDNDAAIARITTTGQVTVFHHAGLATPEAVTPAPDGSIWFADEGTDVIGRVAAVSVPDAPQGLTAVAGNHRATFTWTAPAFDGGTPITSYTVSSAAATPCVWSSGPLTCVVEGLSNGTSYQFTLTATNAQGDSVATWPVEVMPLRFLDVPPTFTFYTDINWMADHGVTTGYADGTFHPFDAVQRQATVAFLYRLAGSPQGSDPMCASAPFTDVGTTHPFCGEIAWAKSTGLTTGFPDGTFRPSDLVTREAIAAFFYRSKGSPLGAHPTCADAPFTDVGVGAPFCGEIAWLKANHVSTGYPDGSFHHAATTDRQATAAFVHRLSDLP